MNRIAIRANITLVIVLILLAGFALFLVEYAMEAPTWVLSEGSPHVYNGSNIGTGVVTDRTGTVLMKINEKRTYSDSEAIRKSTVHWIGDRNGSVVAPALSHYSKQMAGYDRLTGTYVYGENGSVAKLTLSADVQAAALEALGDYKGTVGVYNYKTGQILCAVSTPSFDPDNVPDTESDTTGAYEGMYLNRFTQSLYVPGSIFKIVTLSAALETIPDIQQQTFTCEGSYMIGDQEVICDGVHGRQDLKTAFRNSCNCAFAQIAEQLGQDALEEYVKQFGVTESIKFDGISTTKGNFVVDGHTFSTVWSSIGQFMDQVNPCTYLTFVGAVAAGGKGVNPYLVEEISVSGSDTYTAKTEKRDRVMSEETANTVRELMKFNVQDKYGAENFPGLTVGAKTGTGEVGNGKKPNAVFTGFVEDEAYPLAFIIIVEDAGYGRTFCVPIASKVLSACKAALDAK